MVVMTSTKDELLAELLKERFGTAPTGERMRGIPQATLATRGDGGPDTPAAIERRQQHLCAALDDGPHPSWFERRAA